MAPARGMLLKGLFFPNKRPFPFPPFPHDPKKGGGLPIRAAAPPLLPILTAPLPVRPFRASKTRGIPIEAKTVPIQLPTCFCVILNNISCAKLCAWAKSLRCLGVRR